MGWFSDDIELPALDLTKVVREQEKRELDRRREYEMMERFRQDRMKAEAQYEMDRQIAIAKQAQNMANQYQGSLLNNAYNQSLGNQGILGQAGMAQPVPTANGVLGGQFGQVSISPNVAPTPSSPETEMRELGTKLRIPHRPEHNRHDGAYYLLHDILQKVAERLNMIPPEEVKPDLIDAIMSARE